MKTILFISQLDINLIKFRLPVMTHLVAKGWRVIAMVPKGNYSDEFNKHGIETRWYSLNRKSINPIKELCTVIQYIKIIKNTSPDIVHAFTFKPNIYGGIMARILGVKTVITSITGMGAFFSERTLKARMMQTVITMIYRVVSLFTHAMLFQNKDDQQWFIDKKIIKATKTVCVRGSGIDTKDWSMKRQYPTKKVTFILMARLLVTKGIREYCEAAKIIHDRYGQHAVCRLLGDEDTGNPGGINSAYLAPYITANAIEFLGWRDDIKAQLAAADVFVLPSYREGLSRSGIEATSMGMPIITTNAVGCRELVDDQMNGILIEPQSVNELVEAMEQLINNPDQIRSMGEASRKKAVNEFDVQYVIDAYINLYETIN